MPPSWQVTADELFDPDGSPRFANTYPKGC